MRRRLTSGIPSDVSAFGRPENRVDFLDRIHLLLGMLSAHLNLNS